MAQENSVIEVNGERFVEVPTDAEAQALVTATRRRLADLPDVPQRMNTLAVVLTYELFGLRADDIAMATGLSRDQVGNIMMLDAYEALRSTVVDSIVEADAQGVRDVFIKKARRSAERIVELAESARPDIALYASKEVLDRSGHTVKQIVEHKHQLEGGLVIEVIKRDNSQQVPTIDVTPEVADAVNVKRSSKADGDVLPSPRAPDMQEGGDHKGHRARVSRGRSKKRSSKEGDAGESG